MPRPKLRRLPCDCVDCSTEAPPVHQSTSVQAAIARQEPPPKSLVVLLEGALCPGLGEASLPHLHAAAREGWSGLLAFRAGGPPPVAQLLGLPPHADTGTAVELLPDRFKQLRAVLLADTPGALKSGQQAGCHATQPLLLKGSPLTWPNAGEVARHIGLLLQPEALLAQAAGRDPAATPDASNQGAAAGAQQQLDEEEQECEETVDMVLLVLDAQHTPSGSGPAAEAAASQVQTTAPNKCLPGSSSAPAPSDSDSMAPEKGEEGGTTAGGAAQALRALEWLDALLRWLNAQPGFREAVLLSLVLAPGKEPLGLPPLLQEQPLLQPRGSDFFPVRRPLQSYQAAGLQVVAVDALAPALVVHRLPGVIRQDTVQRLSLKDAQARGGAGCILAERLLPEVAYKLGRAPKYGA